jgi:hypothetical protein
MCDEMTAAPSLTASAVGLRACDNAEFWDKSCIDAGTLEDPVGDQTVMEGGQRSAQGPCGD